MNNKEKLMYMIIDTIVDCCSIEVNGIKSVTAEQVLGKSRAENVVMTRCIVAQQLVNSGYSMTTVAAVLNRSVHGIRHLIQVSDQYMHTSRAYRLAMAQATLGCRDLEPEGL